MGNALDGQHLLSGRVALVTGAGRGLGAAVARELAARGASVVVNDLGVSLDGAAAEGTPAHDVVSQIRAAGGNAIANGEDVSDFEAAGRMIGAAVEEFGRLDILVNVAGILRDRMVYNMSVAEWQAVLAVHLDGTFNTTRHAATHWRSLGDAQPGRRIINFSSASGLYGATGQPNYSAAKLGIVGLTYSCANALAKLGVTCNALAPAADTRMTPHPADQADAEAVARRSPDNCARVVAWLASDQADWCTGQVIGSRGYQVTLYAKPRPVASLDHEGAWDLAELAAQADEKLRPLVAGEEFPTWPPAEVRASRPPSAS
jgi:NAD(P)-dependent dehydrogenase (short-subunit alcohol dehydrogenase family)